MPLEIISGNMSPHCIGLYWLLGPETKQSWSTLGDWNSCYLWKTGMLHQSHWDTLKKHQVERFTNSRKYARGAEDGGSCVWRRKGRRKTSPQLSLSLNGGAAVESGSKFSISLTSSSAPWQYFLAHPPHLAHSSQQQYDLATWKVEGG